MFQNVTLETMLLPLSWLQVSTLPKSCASASPSRLSQDEHTCYFGPRLLWHLRRIPKGLHQASHLIISLGLTAPWLSVFLFFPCLSLRSQQSTSWHRGPSNHEISGDVFLDHLITQRLCLLIDYQVSPVPHVLDFKRMRACMSL